VFLSSHHYPIANEFLLLYSALLMLLAVICSIFSYLCRQLTFHVISFAWLMTHWEPLLFCRLNSDSLGTILRLYTGYLIFG